MKLYRIQANYKNVYLDENVEADNDKAALESFSESYDSEQITEKEGPGFHNPDILFLTLEEVKRDGTTKVNLGETSAGVQMGQSSIGTGQSNS
tara:strand:+ start:2515 stop:2793 length:279 start_codon:yes stop_codon:yes gene_type:complete